MDTQICFDSLEILGWYDGVTLGLGSYRDSYFLTFLVACDALTNRRINAVLPIAETFAQTIRFPGDTTVPENLAVFRKLLNSGLSAHRGDAYLTDDEIDEDKTIKIYQDSEFDLNDFVPLDNDAPFDDLRFESWARRLAQLKG